MSSSEEDADASPRIVPGQLRRWTFELGDGWWPVQRVTTTGRDGLDAAFSFIHRGDTFTVMVVDDPGPYQLPDLDPMTGLPRCSKRWHVVLLRDALCWLEHDWLRASELMCDVP